MYKLYFEDLNLKILLLYKRFVIKVRFYLFVWNSVWFLSVSMASWARRGSLFLFLRNTARPLGMEISLQLILSDLSYNLIVSFGDPVKVLGPPPVWKLYAGSPTSQPVEEIKLNNRLELACYFSHLDWKFFQQFVNILEGFILHYLSNNNHYSFLSIPHLHYYSKC